MDKLIRNVGIRESHKLQRPIVFATNIATSYYKAMGSGFYDKIINQFKRQPNIGEVIFLPNVVSPMYSIEERGEALAERVVKLGKGDKVHLVAYSFCGIDARAALSFNNLDSHVASLTTLCSPHKGLFLMDQV